MEETVNLNFIDEFWRTMCPFFYSYEIIYILLDLVTIITFIIIMFDLPKKLLGGSKKWKY